MMVLTTATVPCSRQRGALRVHPWTHDLQYVSEIVFFVSSTGVVTLDHMKKLNEITLVGNTGHF